MTKILSPSFQTRKYTKVNYTSTITHNNMITKCFNLVLNQNKPKTSINCDCIEIRNEVRNALNFDSIKYNTHKQLV